LTAYFGQDLPCGNIHGNKITAKLTHLGSGYELWANTATGAVAYIDDILTIMDEIKEPEKIKQYLNPTRDDKSLQLATANGPFGAMTLTQTNDYPVAAHVLKEFSSSAHRCLLLPFLPFHPEMSCFNSHSKLTRNPRQRKRSSS
jgi:hypothetical protein